MGISYVPYNIFGLYLGEIDKLKFLAEHGYELDEEEWDEVGSELVSSIPGLENFSFFSADSGGYSCYFGVLCDREEEGKPEFERAFPKIKHAAFQEIVEVC